MWKPFEDPLELWVWGSQTTLTKLQRKDTGKSRWYFWGGCTGKTPAQEGGANRLYADSRGPGERGYRAR